MQPLAALAEGTSRGGDVATPAPSLQSTLDSKDAQLYRASQSLARLRKEVEELKARNGVLDAERLALHEEIRWLADRRVEEEVERKQLARELEEARAMLVAATSSAAVAAPPASDQQFLELQAMLHDSAVAAQQLHDTLASATSDSVRKRQEEEHSSKEVKDLRGLIGSLRAQCFELTSERDALRASLQAALTSNVSGGGVGVGVGGGSGAPPMGHEPPMHLLPPAMAPHQHHAGPAPSVPPHHHMMPHHAPPHREPPPPLPKELALRMQESPAWGHTAVPPHSHAPHGPPHRAPPLQEIGPPPRRPGSVGKGSPPFPMVSPTVPSRGRVHASNGSAPHPPSGSNQERTLTSSERHGGEHGAHSHRRLPWPLGHDFNSAAQQEERASRPIVLDPADLIKGTAPLVAAAKGGAPRSPPRGAHGKDGQERGGREAHGSAVASGHSSGEVGIAGGQRGSVSQRAQGGAGVGEEVVSHPPRGDKGAVSSGQQGGAGVPLLHGTGLAEEGEGVDKQPVVVGVKRENEQEVSQEALQLVAVPVASVGQAATAITRPGTPPDEAPVVPLAGVGPSVEAATVSSPAAAAAAAVMVGVLMEAAPQRMEPLQASSPQAPPTPGENTKERAGGEEGMEPPAQTVAQESAPQVNAVARRDKGLGREEGVGASLTGAIAAPSLGVPATVEPETGAGPHTEEAPTAAPAHGQEPAHAPRVDAGTVPSTAAVPITTVPGPVSSPATSPVLSTPQGAGGGEAVGADASGPLPLAVSGTTSPSAVGRKEDDELTPRTSLRKMIVRGRNAQGGGGTGAGSGAGSGARAGTGTGAPTAVAAVAADAAAAFTSSTACEQAPPLSPTEDECATRGAGARRDGVALQEARADHDVAAAMSGGSYPPTDQGLGLPTRKRRISGSSQGYREEAAREEGAPPSTKKPYFICTGLGRPPKAHVEGLPEADGVGLDVYHARGGGEVSAGDTRLEARVSEQSREGRQVVSQGVEPGNAPSGSPLAQSAAVAAARALERAGAMGSILSKPAGGEASPSPDRSQPGRGARSSPPDARLPSQPTAVSPDVAPPMLARLDNHAGADKPDNRAGVDKAGGTAATQEAERRGGMRMPSGEEGEPTTPARPRAPRPSVCSINVRLPQNVPSPAVPKPGGVLAALTARKQQQQEQQQHQLQQQQQGRARGPDARPTVARSPARPGMSTLHAGGHDAQERQERERRPTRRSVGRDAAPRGTHGPLLGHTQSDYGGGYPQGELEMAGGGAPMRHPTPARGRPQALMGPHRTQVEEGVAYGGAGAAQGFYQAAGAEEYGGHGRGGRALSPPARSLAAPPHGTPASPAVRARRHPPMDMEYGDVDAAGYAYGVEGEEEPSGWVPAVPGRQRPSRRVAVPPHGRVKPPPQAYDPYSTGEYYAGEAAAPRAGEYPHSLAPYPATNLAGQRPLLPLQKRARYDEARGGEMGARGGLRSRTEEDAFFDDGTGAAYPWEGGWYGGVPRMDPAGGVAVAGAGAPYPRRLYPGTYEGQEGDVGDAGGDIAGASMGWDEYQHGEEAAMEGGGGVYGAWEDTGAQPGMQAAVSGDMRRQAVAPASHGGKAARVDKRGRRGSQQPARDRARSGDHDGRGASEGSKQGVGGEDREAPSGDVAADIDPAMQALLAHAHGQGSYKTELCKKWEAAGECPYGRHCRFAHGVEELQPVLRHPRYKTSYCQLYRLGKCPYGHRCHFLHDKDIEEGGDKASAE
eukprot:jgi/Mesvir1/4253/Mv25137-RA.1